MKDPHIKIRVGDTLYDEWRKTIPRGKGQALLRALMNKLVQELPKDPQKRDDYIYRLSIGNFSLRKALVRRTFNPDRIIYRSPVSGRFAPRSR